jgi:hypothetical protein
MLISARRLTFRAERDAKRGKLCKNFRATHRSDSRGDTLRRITKAALGGVASCALILGGTQLASSETLLQQVFPGWLADIDPDNVGPPPTFTPMTGAFDSAKAKLKVTETSGGSTTFELEVKEIDPDPMLVGRTFGSHLHVGPCVTGIDTTSGHYQHQDLAHLPLKDKEVWFEVVPNEHGEAFYRTVVPFVPTDPDGVMSIVIHTGVTNEVTGLAGPKEVCLPLVTTW